MDLAVIILDAITFKSVKISSLYRLYKYSNAKVDASVIFANHFLISNGEGLLVIPENKVPEFKKLLVAYYEDRDNDEILKFMKKYCWKNF